MKILKGLFKQKEQPIKTNQDFWDWFVKHERKFLEVVKKHQNVEADFFDKLSPKLAELKEGYFYLTGMANDHTAELVLTADGAIEHIAFVEDLVADAPKLDNWLFTALKPALDIKDVSIEMANHKFNADNIFFYAQEYSDYPDEIAINVTHSDLTLKNRDAIQIGVQVFLDNLLGELNFATAVDNLFIITKEEAENDWIPIERLKPFLIWREKEFTEKYEGVRPVNSNGMITKAILDTGEPLMGMLDTALLKWDAKASHPWMARVDIKYDGTGNNGLPNDQDYQSMNEIEDEFMAILEKTEGHLNIGRETGGNQRTIYLACKDFRLVSKVLYGTQQQYAGRFEIGYSIYKDKYWTSLDRLVPVQGEEE